MAIIPPGKDTPYRAPQGRRAEDDRQAMDRTNRRIDNLWRWMKQVREILGLDDTFTNPQVLMRWVSPYVFGPTYKKGDVVYDGGYLMIANKETTDRAAPQTIGVPAWVYTGSSPETQIIARTLLTGNTYTFATAGSVARFRCYMKAGNTYSAYVKDNDTGVVTELFALTADATGWQEFNSPGSIYEAGTSFDLGLFIDEPAVSPDIWDADYDYVTPNNAGAPLAGQVLQATRDISIVKVSFTDNEGGPSREPQLDSMSLGDVINGPGISWAIQTKNKQNDHYEFGVAPASQGSPIGNFNFTFETTAPTPITTLLDVDFYQLAQYVQPFYAIDGGPQQSSDDGFGIDVEWQEASISEDWDLMARSE